MTDPIITRGPFEQRRLAAIVFTDVVGYSARTQRDEAGTLALVHADFERMGALCAEHGGEILNTMGDGMLFCFPSAVQAVACALQIQLEFGRRRESQPPELSLEHRIGIHLGDVYRKSGGVVGDGVNIAARLQTKAPPGGICISQTVNDTVKGKLAMQSICIGPQSFKNLGEPITVYHLAPQGTAALTRPPLPATAPSPRRRWRRRMLMTAGFGLAAGLLLAGGAYAWWGQRPKKLSAATVFANGLAKEGRVLVADFENQTGDPAHARLGPVIVDRVRQEAPQVGWVRSAHAADPGLAHPAENAGAIKKLGTKTAADALVTGAYYREGSKLLFRSRILDLRNGTVFADLAPIAGDPADASVAIEEFTQRILGALDTLGLTRSATPVSADQMFNLSRPPRLDAREAMRAGLEVGPPLDDRLRHLRRSYELDPQGCLGALVWQAVVLVDAGRYAEADALVRDAEKFPERLTPYFRAALSWARAALAGDVAGVLDAAGTARGISQGSFVWIDKAARALLYTNRPKKFLELMTVPEPAQAFVDRIPETWIGRACAYNLLGERDKELAAAKRARELDPEDPTPLALLARAEAALGHTTEVDAAIEESFNLQPTAHVYPGLIMLAAVAEYRLTGQAAPAEALLARTLSWYANRSPHESAQEALRLDLARLHCLAGNHQQAHELATSLHKDFPDNIAYLGLLGICEARLGHRERANAILAELRSLNPKFRFGEQLYLQARLAAVLGRPDDALQWLREAMVQRSVPVARFSLDFVRAEPDLEPLRALPAYKAILSPRG